jgi:tetratricopeptide (TPR) repeat protein
LKRGDLSVDFHETVNRIDTLLHECRLDEAEKLMIESIDDAHKRNDTEAEKYFLNEQIGFYRDCGKFPESLESAKKARLIFENSGDTDTIQYGTTLLNCANCYRAAGEYDNAFETYDIVKAIYSRLLPEDDNLVASFYNNIALLYQETENWNAACDSLNHALEIVRHKNDMTKIAISCTNLAVSLLHINETDTALELLNEADSILSGRYPSDFHYSAVLGGFGDAYYQLGEYDIAADYYECTLSEIELHMGRNNFYSIVYSNLEKAYEKAGKSRPVLSGLELSRRFYKKFGEPVLKKNFADIIPYIAVGLAGEGSECLGYDDKISHDHDYGPCFCIWVSGDISATDRENLQKAYSALPKSYMGVTRIETKQAAGRTGVQTTGEFFSRLIGLPHIPETEQEWLNVEESGLAAVCSGDIFMDESGVFTSYREKLKSGYPETVRLRRFAQLLGLMAQSGQYNYMRMRKRRDYAAAQIYLVDFCQYAMQAAHLCSRVYAPYKKWLMRSTHSLKGFEEFADDVQRLILSAPQTNSDYDENTDEICQLIQKICNRIAKETLGTDMENKNIYLQDAAEELFRKAVQLENHEELVQNIVKLEWNAFDKVQNIGGRASCQDDWETFSIMRSSQYKTWDYSLLKKWVEEFHNAYESGRNLITEKYARMMESTDPERYDEIKNNLPAITDDFIKIREAIVGIQVSWMDEFAERYPKLSSDARSVHTETDSIYATSYETYLRGELTTYSADMLYEYGRWITSLYRDGKNLAFMIMEETVHAYGYKSLDDAENKHD